MLDASSDNAAALYVVDAPFHACYRTVASGEVERSWPETPLGSMLIFNHIPRTAGTFLQQEIRQSGFAAGPRVHLGRPEKWAPDILCGASYRPVMLIYHVCGGQFARVYRREPGDFAFTFLRNRVDMIYSNFAYMKARVERGDEPRDWSAAQVNRFRGTINEHVDELLRLQPADQEYPPDLALYDFVGITEEMDRSLRVFNSITGTSLRNTGVVNSATCEKNHRRDELERWLAPQMELFHCARARLVSLSERIDC